jgi:DNA polymerase
MEKVYVPGSGNSNAKLLIVAEAPGEQEERLQVPLVGPTGKEVDALLLAAGSSRDAVYCTNVVKYRPPGNDLRRLSELGLTIEEGIPQLWEEIEAIKPNAILSLGNLSTKVVTGLGEIKNLKESIVGKYRGSILRSYRGGYKVIPTIHPAAYLNPKRGGGAYKYLTRAYVQADIKRAVDESRYKEYDIPKRFLEVCKSSSQLYKFIERYKDHDKAFMDIEAIHCVPVCIGFAFMPNHAISIPLRNAADWLQNPIPDHELDQIWRLIDRILRTKKIIAQNAKYDIEKLEALGFRVNYHADTSLMSHTVHPEFPKSLEFLTSIYTREPFYKNEYEDFVEKSHKMEDLMTYNGKDCCVMVEIYDALNKELERLYGPV